MNALEAAIRAGKSACYDINVQFLDETVSSVAYALKRDESGRLALQRTYRFEFTETGNTRREGRLTLLGTEVKSINMEPYRIQP